MVTKCEHFFCERCALRHFQKTRRCYVCAEQTAGIFNHAKAIQARIDLREEARAARLDAGRQRPDAGAPNTERHSAQRGARHQTPGRPTPNTGGAAQQPR